MKRYPAQDLEPAERDPKKLRRTAFALVGVMLLGSVFVLAAYNRDAAARAEDERPAIVTRLEKNFKVWRQDESEAGLLAENPGDRVVQVIAPVVFREPESWEHTRGVLRRLDERFGERDDFRIVCITLDPENEPPEFLAEAARDLGAELPGWWVCGSREESVHKFFKNTLKAGVMPTKREDGWHYDPALVLIDRDRHVRQATVRARKPSGKELNYRQRVTFDFEQAARWDAEGRSEGVEKTNLETLEDLLVETIEYVLDETPED